VINKNGVSGKVCSSCDTWKPLEEFSPGGKSHGSSQGGRHCQCKSCNALAHQRQRALLSRARQFVAR
jgi:hypothetical protein